MYKYGQLWYNIYMIDTDRKEGTDMGIIELDNTYSKVLSEYHNSPSGSKKEFELSKKLDKLDKEISKEIADTEFDWGSD